MPNGKIGDHPLTDIIIHGQPTWSPRADRLVCEIVQLGGREQLEREVNIWEPPERHVLESRLQSIRDRLRTEAKARGWEARADIPPQILGNARVLLWTPIDQRHRATGTCHHEVPGEHAMTAAGLAVCQYEGESGYFLFRCDLRWQVLADTWHETIDAAKGQAEFEYMGASSTWEQPA